MTSAVIIHESLNTGTGVGVLTFGTVLLPGHVTLGSVSLEVLRLQGEMSHSEGGTRHSEGFFRMYLLSGHLGLLVPEGC